MIEWIKSSKQLPKDEEQVLCWNGHRIVQDSYSEHTEQDSKWFIIVYTHWMPIIKTPKDLKCEFCNGNGEVEKYIEPYGDSPMECSFCNGTGIDQE